MLTPECDEILRLQLEAQHSFLVISTDQGTFVNVNGQVLGVDTDSNKAYVLAVDDLIAEGLVKQIGDHAFDLTTAGRLMADALYEEERVAKMVPDSCRIIIREDTYSVSYIGANRTDLGVDEFNIHHAFQFKGKTWDAHAGIFQVKSNHDDRTFCVLLNPLNIPNIGYLKDKDTISRSTLDLLFKRPGWCVIRDYLFGTKKVNQLNVLEYPKFPEDEVTGLPETIEQYINVLDGPREQILSDCERDILRILIEDRKRRKPVGSTAAEIAANPTKRRFYSVREHIRETLGDLSYKELIRTDDRVHYQIEVSRMADARRVVTGLPSDDLFDAQPPGRLAAYIPKSTEEFDAFLCHASEDKDAIVRPFADAMTEIDLKPWFDEGQVKWGDNLVTKIQYGLSKSRFAVVFLSEAFLAKKWPDTELNTALSLEIGGKTFVLPILIGLTHETLQARYPMVSAKVYREVSDYNSETSVDKEIVKTLVGELKALIYSP